MNEEQLSQRYNFTPGVTERKRVSKSEEKKSEKKSAMKQKQSDD
jgi:hypothetical protein